ncbi:MAG TPA: hypothetical protein VLW65_11250 [Bryobacteraceae bacterium]|nr:hypothetical protein [Bryobacteraceae bacterium]
MPRIFLWAACAVFSVLPLPAQQPRVGIFMDFERVPGPAAVAAMEQEVNQLLKPAGITLDWRLAKENRGNLSFASLVVLRFKGSCKVEPLPGSAGDFGSFGETHALASTTVSGGRVLPFSEVECDEVRGALRFLRAGAGLKERQLALGRALGRVVAHELYHIFARTTAHGARGLAKPSQSLEELVSVEGPKFGEDDSRAMGKPAAVPEEKTR